MANIALLKEFVVLVVAERELDVDWRFLILDVVGRLDACLELGNSESIIVVVIFIEFVDCIFDFSTTGGPK